LAREANVGGVVSEDVEDLELVFRGRLEQLTPLEDEHPARSAAGASARKWNGRGLLVANIHEAGRAGHFDRNRWFAVERLENDEGHSLLLYCFSSAIACSERGRS
jgi:hypothetical protein